MEDLWRVDLLSCLVAKSQKELLGTSHDFSNSNSICCVAFKMEEKCADVECIMYNTTISCPEHMEPCSASSWLLYYFFCHTEASHCNCCSSYCFFFLCFNFETCLLVSYLWCPEGKESDCTESERLHCVINVFCKKDIQVIQGEKLGKGSKKRKA